MGYRPIVPKPRVSIRRVGGRNVLVAMEDTSEISQRIQAEYESCRKSEEARIRRSLDLDPPVPLKQRFLDGALFIKQVLQKVFEKK